MCEYCGCRAIDTIGRLTEEHEAVVDVIGATRRALAAGDDAAVVSHVREIVSLLRPHTAVEEHGLFPALAREYPDHVARLHDEHERIEAALAAVPGVGAADGSADPRWRSRLADALTLLREHILTEENGVFPAALATLEPEDWAGAEEVRARVGAYT